MSTSMPAQSHPTPVVPVTIPTLSAYRSEFPPLSSLSLDQDDAPVTSLSSLPTAGSSQPTPVHVELSEVQMQAIVAAAVQAMIRAQAAMPAPPTSAACCSSGTHGSRPTSWFSNALCKASNV
ncbi:hypothetical protein DFJ73DRAFT_782728 [Zopfochytrium polystomum]|nr:hypothetical protein DFJ73DRAFT_782728 [Zopfochytrium polystomum]